MVEYSLEKADMDLFAVYQVIYSGTDIEMWFDWNTRLNDTKFTDHCYWIMHEDVKIGGAIINSDTVIYPFIIPPFSDRFKFWDILLKCCKEIKHINGMLHDDVNILLSSGFKVNVVRQVMCRPADINNKVDLPDGFSMYALNEAVHVNELSKVIISGYAGGIDHEIYGVPNEDQVIKDNKYLMEVYKHRNLSIYIVNEMNQEIVALCIAGISENMPLGFAEIGEVCVLPQYRNKGIAEFMLRHIIATAFDYTPVVKLCVTVGNQAENLYRKVGFQPGPRFANMSKR
ncbi:GNAT family N-acetyltransferase [Paenibacillus sp. FSL W7-1287]|uniref:GNAT family N-acetyltransferase n=1 Tax=Paenibacillus sp. FSL W7-1287 TaxID=2954538 RepID=UPI0030FC3682